MSQKHVLPDKLLNHLNENTAGFILFTLDGNGSPSVYTNLDSEIHSIGLHNFIRHYSDTIETMHSNAIFESISGQSPDQDEEN